MLNKKLIVSLFAINSLICMSQSLIYGGFASFSISESIGANSGGSILWQDSRTSCIMVQGGHVYGSTEMFNNTVLFRETCKNISPTTDIKVYPNPGFGDYWVEGQNISSIEIFDNLGRQVLSTNVRDNLFKIPISISDQPEGNYFVKILDNAGEQWVFSLIKLEL
jgi:hypothetical protein